MSKRPLEKQPASAEQPGKASRTTGNTSGPQTLRGVPLPPDWRVIGGSLLVWSYLEPTPSAEVIQAATHPEERTACNVCQQRPVLCPCQVAAFDFDGCLAKTSFGGGPDDWNMMFPSVAPTLSRLHAEGKRIVIVTNESLDRLKKPEAIAKAVGNKLGRVQGFAKAAGVPMLVLCATAKDEFRKPAPGAWAHFVECNGGVKVNKSKSFFVGDAAGRQVWGWGFRRWSMHIFSAARHRHHLPAAPTQSSAYVAGGALLSAAHLLPLTLPPSAIPSPSPHDSATIQTLTASSPRRSASPSTQRMPSSGSKRLVGPSRTRGKSLARRPSLLVCRLCEGALRYRISELQASTSNRRPAVHSLPSDILIIEKPTTPT
jgi:DNA 3'-phosphatase